MTPPQTFIMLGRSGCGKGTQSRLLLEHLEKHFPSQKSYYLEIGAKFREFVQQDTYTSRLSREQNAKGMLQPEFIAVWAWADLLIKHLGDDEHLIIDGTPRKVHEAQVLDKALQFYGRQKPFFVFMDVSREWSRDRLIARHRSDDSEEDIERRLAWYETDVVPAINFFRNNSHYSFVEIDGEQPIEDVHAEVIQKLGLEAPVLPEAL